MRLAGALATSHRPSPRAGIFEVANAPGHGRKRRRGKGSGEETGRQDHGRRSQKRSFSDGHHRFADPYAGSAPHYSYRALLPLDQIDPARRHRVAILHVQTRHSRLPCTRIADTIAPDHWFERNLAVPCGLAARLNLVGRRVEAILLRSVFSEMVTYLAPLALLLDHDPGSAVHPIATIDLNAAFDAITLRIDMLMAADLDLHQGAARHAA